jgi:APA family basic amino acid/polyamine antiporter
VTTGLFVVACVVVVIARSPINNSLVGFLILLAGIPACRYWQRANKPGRA